MAAFTDHLWQSILVFVLLQLCVGVVGRNAAIVRLTMWRIAALKFVVPFHLLFSLGGWLGFPVQHSADQVPHSLTAPIETLTPLVSPVQSHGVTGFASSACLVALLVAGLGCARLIFARLRLERWRTTRERARVRRDPDDVAPGLGFIRGFAFAALTSCVVASPLLAGAIEDRELRHSLLVENARALRDATIEMRPAAPGMGGRVRVAVDARGVSIRNATIRDLASLAYGVNRFFVRGDHFYEAGEQDWLIAARYDLRIAAPIREPGRFDTYALRRPVTQMLAERHGLEIYVNSVCQPPCGKYGVAMPDEPL
jgi:hypothetical protein